MPCICNVLQTKQFMKRFTESKSHNLEMQKRKTGKNKTTHMTNAHFVLKSFLKVFFAVWEVCNDLESYNASLCSFKIGGAVFFLEAKLLCNSLCHSVTFYSK